VAAQDLGASVGGGETPERLELGPTPALRPPNATRELLTRTIDSLTELVQTEEARYHKSVHQRLVDGLKAADRVLPLILRRDDAPAVVREAESALQAAAYAGGDARVDQGEVAGQVEG
jgi:hypothetical protein